MNKTFVILLVAFFLSPIFSLLSTQQVHADWLLDRSGTLVQVDGYVLGEDDVNEEEIEDQKLEVKEFEKKRMEQAREMAKNRQEVDGVIAKKKLETQIEARKKVQEKIGHKSEVEVKNEANRLKIKQEIRDKNDAVVRRQEVEIKDGERFMVEGEDKERVSINAVKDGRLELVKDKIKTTAEMELKVGDKNEISVTLPNGKVREVALPDKALEKLVANGVITQTEGEENAYELTTGKNGEPVYEVEGRVEKKFLGVFKMNFAHKMAVSAGDSEDGSVAAGDVVETETRENGWRRFLERLAI